MRIISLIISVITLNTVYSQKLELWASSPNVIVGEKIHFTLSITEMDTLEFIKSKKEQFSVVTDNKFSYSFVVIPEYTGKYKIGPFSISYEGKELTSNVIEMNVVEPDVKALIILLELPEKVKQNDKVTITFIGTLTSLNEIKLKESENFQVISSGINSNLTFENGKSIKVFKKSFVVKFLQKGSYLVDYLWLESLREYSKVESKIIKVN